MCIFVSYHWGNLVCCLIKLVLFCEDKHVFTVTCRTHITRSVPEGTTIQRWGSPARSRWTSLPGRLFGLETSRARLWFSSEWCRASGTEYHHNCRQKCRVWVLYTLKNKGAPKDSLQQYHRRMVFGWPVSYSLHLYGPKSCGWNTTTTQCVTHLVKHSYVWDEKASGKKTPHLISTQFKNLFWQYIDSTNNEKMKEWERKRKTKGGYFKQVIPWQIWSITGQ